MHSDTFEQLLDRAATLCGIGPGFWDIWGTYHETTREAKQAILRAKGLDAAGAASLERSLAARTRHDWDRLLPHSIVTGEAESLWPSVLDDFRNGRLRRMYKQPKRPLLSGLRPDRSDRKSVV